MYGHNSKEVIAVKRAYAAVNVGEDVDEFRPVPSVCSTPVFSPSSILWNGGGPVTVKSSCSNEPFSIEWTRNGLKLPATGAGGETTTVFSLPYNIDSNEQYHTVCVVAENVAGKSAPVCDRFVVKGKPPRPACTTIDFHPFQMPWSGGTLNLKATCSGGVSEPNIYSWYVNHLPVPGANAVNINTVLPANTSAAIKSIPVCVYASNSVGNSGYTCTSVVQQAAPVTSPTCSGVTLTPASLPASGGAASAVANCSGSGPLNYAWTFNGAPYGGNGASISGTVGANSGSGFLLHGVCVVASNSGGSSGRVCANLYQSAPPASVPVCSGVTVTPATLPTAGGHASAQANCTGSGTLVYSWSFNGAAYGGNSSSIADTVGANLTGRAQSYPVCVTAANASGSGNTVCANLNQQP